MIEIIAKHIMKPDDIQIEIRNKYGIICSIVGIIFNIILCTLKIITGIISGSISIMADGINNLSDASSSIVTLFRI